MRYLLIISLLSFNIALVAAAQAADKTAQQKVWTDEYQYGAKENSPKTGKPEEGGEFEVAPKKAP